MPARPPSPRGRPIRHPDDLPDAEIHQLQEERSRGFQAQSILDHPLVEEAIRRIRADVLESFAGAAPEDHEARRMAQCKLLMLNEVVSDLRDALETGQMAEVQLSAWDAFKAKFRKTA